MWWRRRADCWKGCVLLHMDMVAVHARDVDAPHDGIRDGEDIVGNALHNAADNDADVLQDDEDAQ